MTRVQQRGFTLIELIIFIVIVGASLAGILSVMNTVVKSSADPMVRKQAIAMAESIMEEIMLRAYEDPVGPVCLPEDGDVRACFDHVSAYDKIEEATFTDLPVELSAYKILIAVSDAEDFLGVYMKKVTVTVSRGSESVSLTSYRAQDAT